MRAMLLGSLPKYKKFWLIGLNNIIYFTVFLTLFALVPFWDYNYRMRVIAKKYLVQFWRVHRDAEQPLKAWYDDVVNANWSSPQDIKNHYRNASFLGNNRVVFNIKGNDYRLIVAVAYRLGVFYIKFIGTHAEYDSVNAKTVGMEGI